MTDGPWGSPAPPPPPPSGGAPRPTAAQPPRQASDGGGSAAFRDTLIVAALAVIGVAVMFVWSGGDAPEAATEVPTGTLPDEFATLPGLSPPASDDLPTIGGASVPGETFGSPDPAANNAEVVAALPAPAGGEEQAPTFEGGRTWLVGNPDWRAVRDEWVAAVTAAGFTVNVSTPLTDPSGAEVGESMNIFAQGSPGSVFATVQGLPDGTTSVVVLA